MGKSAVILILVVTLALAVTVGYGSRPNSDTDSPAGNIDDAAAFKSATLTSAEPMSGDVEKLGADDVPAASESSAELTSTIRDGLADSVVSAASTEAGWEERAPSAPSATAESSAMRAPTAPPPSQGQEFEHQPRDNRDAPLSAPVSVPPPPKK